jgi:hypothetical protein
MREASPWRKKGEDDTSWGDANLTGPKNEESPDLATINFT